MFSKKVEKLWSDDGGGGRGLGTHQYSKPQTTKKANSAWYLVLTVTVKNKLEIEQGVQIGRFF